MKVYHCFILALGLPSLADASERFKGVDLWLPTTYQSHYTRFLEAAEKAQNDPYCVQLLSGRLRENASDTEQLLFQFRCRSDDKQMFSIQVDGETLAIENRYGELRKQQEDVIEAADKAVQKQLDEEEAKRVAAKLAERRREQSQYWRICRKEMRQRLKPFEGVTILTDSLPEPSIQADQFTYTVLFDALNPAKKVLHFKVECTISALDYYQVAVKPRKVINNQ